MDCYQSGFSFDGAFTCPPHLVCPPLGVKNAFSTRLGGVSHVPYLSSLDLGTGQEDYPDEVRENRRRFASLFGLPPERLVFARQIHSAEIVAITEKNRENAFACDGFVTDCPGIILAVKSADCVPILLSDKKRGVIGAVHAGWRGTAAGIALRAIAAMASYGCRTDDIRAAIGPCIHACCYEVDEPFHRSIEASPNGKLLETAIEETGNPTHKTADLVKMNRLLLTEAGVSPAHIYATGFCTCCQSDLFFSHRASNGKRGLLMAGIALG